MKKSEFELRGRGITRRVLLQRCTRVALSSLAVGAFATAAMGCGDETAPPVTSSCGVDGGALARVTTSMSFDHGHRIDVDVASLGDGRKQTFALSSADGHTHEVTLDERQIAELASGGTVTQASTVDSGHAHSVTFSAQCA